MSVSISFPLRVTRSADHAVHVSLSSQSSIVKQQKPETGFVGLGFRLSPQSVAKAALSDFSSNFREGELFAPAARRPRSMDGLIGSTCLDCQQGFFTFFYFFSRGAKPLFSAT
jgi:hypothetical protein